MDSHRADDAGSRNVSAEQRGQIEIEQGRGSGEKTAAIMRTSTGQQGGRKADPNGKHKNQLRFMRNWFCVRRVLFDPCVSDDARGVVRKREPSIHDSSSYLFFRPVYLLYFFFIENCASYKQ